MTAVAATTEFRVPHSFTVEELYELQRRKGKPAEPKYTYEMRNKLKLKFALQNRADGLLRRSAYIIFQDLWTTTFAFFTAPDKAVDYMAYRLWGYTSNVDNIRSGRSRMKYFRPSDSQNLAARFQA